jgi:hypothetical protein
MLRGFKTTAAAETKPESQKGEIQWTTSITPLANLLTVGQPAKHRTDSRKAQPQLQHA